MIELTDIESFITAQIGSRWQASAPPVDSSGRRRAQIIQGDRLSFFVKFATGSDALNKARCEEQALQRLSQIRHIRTPDIIGVLGTSEDAALIMRAVNPVPPRNEYWSQLGEMIATLHRESWTHFGLDYNNFIGDFQQNNTPASSWNSFYADYRVRPMLERAVNLSLLEADESLRVERVLDRIDLLSPLNEAPSLLHGDLWRENVIFDEQGPLLIDPAISFGNREMDIAFGMMAPHLTFDQSFYESYFVNNPLHEDYEFRQGLWQVWPLLTHIIQDGRTWVTNLMDTIDRYL
jgi:protein-ribulosamine 3-kinase